VVDHFLESVIEIVVQLVVVLVTLFLDLGQDEEFEASESSIREILGFLTTWSSGKHQPRIGLPSASKHCSRLQSYWPISSFWLGNWI
jgi:hypothetical protein